MEILKKKEFYISGIILLLCSIAGKYLAFLPGLNVIGHLVIALLLGMFLQAFKGIKKAAKGASHFIANKFLRLGIILMGFRLNLEVLIQHGIKTITLAIVVITFTILVIYYLSKSFKVDSKLGLLSACGCGVCGAAAVLGVSGSIGSSEDDEVIAVAIVAILGTVFTLIMAISRPILNLNEVQYGVLAGASLHEIAHAVAAGNAGGAVSENIATIVKLSRVLMLAPLSIILSLLFTKNKEGSNEKLKIAIPWFMLGFIISSAIGTYAGFSQEIIKILIDAAYILLGMAMAALGVNVHFKVVLEKGQKIFVISFVGSALLFTLVYFIARFFF